MKDFTTYEYKQIMYLQVFDVLKKHLLKRFNFFNLKYHWYEVNFEYRKKHYHKPIFTFPRKVGLRNQADILNDRVIKKIIEPLHHDPIKKAILSNGKLFVTTVCYLGYFKKNY